MELCFVTNNEHKLREIRSMLVPSFHIISLQDIGCLEDIPEDYSTIAENSLFKANYVHKRFKINCFADDTGLEVFSLGGEPGVNSARYAGEAKNSSENIRLLLENLKDKVSRKAQFKTVITLCMDQQFWQFEGIVPGEILREKRGTGGFGYDPVFVPEGFELTFAQMTPEMKNRISHRGLAIQKLVDFLNNSGKGNA